MKIYVRKIMNHDITHEIGLTVEVVKDFFDNENEIEMYYKGDSQKWNVTINNVTDPRLGGDIRDLLKKHGDIKENDFILIEKQKNEYIIEIIRNNDFRYETYSNLLTKIDRHLIIHISNNENIDYNKNYTEEELGKILKEYRKAFPSAMSAATHLFGLKYGKIIKDQKLSQVKIIKSAEIPDSLKDELSKGMKLSEIINLDIVKNKSESNDQIDLEKIDCKKGGYNKILFGVPGTGKSYKIDKELENVDKENKIRVTFHPEYTYNDFIGQLLPKIDKDGNIIYAFQPGQFTIALKRAYTHPKEDVYLIIEEMSRGNCAAIFGDIFQLLDRENSGDMKDWSKYSIDNEIIAKEVGIKNSNKIKIPSNLYIFGTVNTSDQNVFVMDTAFKRRFEWEYISTDLKESENLNNVDISIFNNNEKIIMKWGTFYKLLNKFISSKDMLDLGEDKQIGRFFIKFDDNNYEKNKEKIKNKLLNYLWFDVNEVSYKNDISLFDKDITNFSDLYEKFEKDNKIYSEEFLNYLKENN